MNSFLNRTLLITAISLCAALAAANAMGAPASITAEKNCSVRIEGGDFREGDKVLVFRDMAGKKSKLAVMEVTKRTGPNNFLAQKVQGPKLCTALKGASVEAYEGLATKPGEGKKTAPALEADLSGLFALVSQRGLLVGTPGEHFAQNPASLKAVGIALNADAYPLAFGGRQGAFQRGLGLGVSFGYGSVFPKSDVPPADNPTGAKVGTLATSVMNVDVSLIFRLLYLQDIMTTEIRTAVFLMHGISHKYAGESEGTSSLPIVNLSTSGLGVALRQRFALTPQMRLNAGFLFPFGLKGKASYLTGESAGLSKPSGYFLDLSADYYLEKLKLCGGFSFGSFGGSLATKNESKGVDETFKVEDSRVSFWAGVGYHL